MSRLSECFIEQWSKWQGTVTSRENAHFSGSLKATRLPGIGFNQEHDQDRRSGAPLEVPVSMLTAKQAEEPA